MARLEWSAALYPESPRKAEEHTRELIEAVESVTRP